MFNELNWTTLDKRSSVNLILLVYKCLKGDAPEYIGTKFTYVTLDMPIQQNQAVVEAYINRRLRHNQGKEHSNTVKMAYHQI